MLSYCSLQTYCVIQITYFISVIMITLNLFFLNPIPSLAVKPQPPAIKIPPYILIKKPSGNGRYRITAVAFTG